MSKRNKPYRPKPALVPPLVACKITENDADLQTHLIIEKMRNGTADTHDFGWLADTHGGLLFGAKIVGDSGVLRACEMLGASLRSIRERHTRTGKFGCTGGEYNDICSLAEIYVSFWPQHPARVLIDANRMLLAARGNHDRR